MVITQDTSDALYQIRAYSSGQIKVNETIYQQSLIVTAQDLITDWQPQSFAELEPEHWLALLNYLEKNSKNKSLNWIILFGTGAHFQMPKPHLLAPLYQQKVGVESMDTGAACRTYTALISEGRQVIAALLVK